MSSSTTTPTKHQLLSTIASFLSDCSTEEQQDFSSLFTKEENAAIINSSCSSSIPKDFFAIILCGSSVLDTLRATANLFFLKITMSSSSKSKKLPPLIFITGGIGHSTKFLYDVVQKAYPELFGNDDDEEVAKKSTLYSSSSEDNNNKPSCVVPESHIFRKILVEIYKIPQEFIIVEDQSTNCGANAELTVPLILEKFTSTKKENDDEDENTSTSNKHEESKTMKNNSSSPHTLLLLQDPTMQLRSRLSFEKHLSSNTTKFKIKSICTPFCTSSSSTSSSTTERRKCPYDFNDRYVSLIMGEIPRLRNDEKGYGPKGRNFIAAFDDIPDEVEDASRTLEKVLEEDEGAKSRKL